jgi:hypothetical protein
MLLLYFWQFPEQRLLDQLRVELKDYRRLIDSLGKLGAGLELGDIFGGNLDGLT